MTSLPSSTAVGSPLPDLLLAALAQATTGVSITDATAPDGPLVYVNRAWEELTGYPSAEVVGRNPRLLQPVGADRAPVRQLRSAVRAGAATSTVLLNQRRDGSLFWNELRLSPVHGVRGAVTHFLGFQLDVTARVEAAERLEAARAGRTATGPSDLPDLPLLLQLLDDELHRTRPGRATGLLVCRLHGVLAGTRGPGAGGPGSAAGPADEAVLLAVAGRLRAALRSVDVLARRDGSAFAALLTDLPADAADEVLARAGAAVLSCLEEPVAVDGALYPLGASVGVAVHRGEPFSAGLLLQAAERALASGTASTG